MAEADNFKNLNTTLIFEVYLKYANFVRRVESSKRNPKEPFLSSHVSKQLNSSLNCATTFADTRQYMNFETLNCIKYQIKLKLKLYTLKCRTKHKLLNI